MAPALHVPRTVATCVTKRTVKLPGPLALPEGGGPRRWPQTGGDLGSGGLRQRASARVTGPCGRGASDAGHLDIPRQRLATHSAAGEPPVTASLGSLRAADSSTVATAEGDAHDSILVTHSSTRPLQPPGSMHPQRINNQPQHAEPQGAPVDTAMWLGMHAHGGSSWSHTSPDSEQT